MSILDKTINFFELYRYICGESEVPDMYHFWSAVSLLAATVEDRIWYEKFAHEKLFPNLYILLVGPSGLGKGTAISHALRLSDFAVTINKFRGRLTGAHLIDHLGKPRKDEAGNPIFINPKLWLVMDELKNDVSTNKKLVEDFLYLMTEIYTAGNYTIQTGTRTWGEVKIERPIINWLAGTTENDLKWVITRELLDSGFTARTCFVFGDYNFDKRLPRIKYPHDYDDIFKHLCYRLWALQHTAGRMLITPAADAEVDKWYLTRPAPDEELLASAWRRQHDLLLKFSMILSLADSGPLVMNRIHVMRAKEMVAKLYQFNQKLVGIGSENLATQPANDVLRYLQKHKQIDHTTASRYMRSSRGMPSYAFKRAIVELESLGLVERFMNERKATFYAYRGD